MKADEQSPEHIPLAQLWEVRTTSGLLSDEEVAHFTHCGRCINIWGICLMSHSLEDAERRVREQPK
jgi:hypothetical protein